MANALKLAAQSLGRSHSYLGEYFRRMRAKLGAPKAITAAAHKLARIIYTLVKTRNRFDETVFAHQEKRYQERYERMLHNQAKRLGFQLVPLSQNT